MAKEKKTKKRGRKKKIDIKESGVFDDELDILSEDRDYVSISTANTRVSINPESASVSDEEETPVYEEDAQEEAVNEVIYSEKTAKSKKDEKEFIFNEITESPFKIKDRVSHPKYGEGTIEGQYGEGDYLKVLVRFDNIISQDNQLKLFLVKNAPLKKISRKKARNKK